MLFLGIVSAQITRYSPQDIILRISGNTNAHGEIYSQNTSGYTNIYYSDIFGNTYAGSVTPANLRICSGSNRVLRLSNDTNAHAQAPSFTAGTLYDIDVCYGDLVCTAVPGNNNCLTNYKEVVSLSANNNAHIENATANQYTGAGNSKICCLAPPPSISNPTWRYYDGTQIDPNARVCRNNHVIARVQTNNIADGTPLIFEFYDADGPLRDSIANLTGSVQSNAAQIVLPLNDSGVQAALQSALGFPELGNNLELIFEVSIPGDTKTSYQIIYEDNASLCSFDPPNSVIQAPKHRGIYYANTPVTFNASCISQVGPSQVEWTITPQNGQAFTRTESVFNYTFTSPGQANVKLKCTDSQGRFDINENQILVVASPYTLAYINKPSFNEIVYRSPPALGPYFPNEIAFSASDSFVVNSSACTLECLGGNCPNQTENSLMSCESGGGPISITAQPIVSYSSLFFNWTFMDSDWTNEWAQYETGNGIYSGLVQYDDMSNALNDKRANVKVTYTGSPSVSAEFERSFTLGRCLNNGNTYYASTTEFYSTTEKNGQCRGGDLQIGTADDCCPTGLACINDTPILAQSYCRLPPGGGQPIIDCNDFKNSSACNGNTNPSIPQASYGGIPPACTELKCQWSNTTNSCGLNITTYANSSTTGACSTGPEAIVVSSCSYTMTVSACTNGFKTITYISTPGCQKPPVNVRCGSLSFELSFFGIRQFLIAMLLIGAIYLALNFRKEIKYENKR